MDKKISTKVLEEETSTVWVTVGEIKLVVLLTCLATVHTQSKLLVEVLLPLGLVW